MSWEVLLQYLFLTTAAEPPKSGKKRGRPRKADQKVEKPKYDPEEKNEPEIGR